MLFCVVCHEDVHTAALHTKISRDLKTYKIKIEEHMLWDFKTSIKHMSHYNFISLNFSANSLMLANEAKSNFSTVTKGMIVLRTEQIFSAAMLPLWRSRQAIITWAPKRDIALAVSNPEVVKKNHFTKILHVHWCTYEIRIVPIPELAPVIMTTFPERFLFFKTSDAVWHASTLIFPLTLGFVLKIMRGSM